MKLFASLKRTVPSHSTLCGKLHNRTRGEERFLMSDNLKPPGHPSDVRQVAANTLTFGLSLAEKIAQCAPIPGLKGAIAALNLILNSFDNAAQNLEDLDDVISSIDKMNDILSMFEDTSSTGRALTDDLGEQLFLLSGKLAEAKQEMERVKKHSKLRRIVEAPKDA